MKNLFYYYFILLGCLFFFNSCETDIPEVTATSGQSLNAKSTAQKKRVLLVGIDGLQFERIASLNTPNLDKLHISKAYTGGIQGYNSHQTTSSGPGWTTILTGVWKDKHGVPNNDAGTYKSRVKSIYRLIKENKNDASIASIATWSPIHQFLENDMSLVNYKSKGGNDSNATNLGVNQIKNNDHDLIFIHLDHVDVVGHSLGFSTGYDNAIKTADTQLGQLMNAIEEREAITNEDWLIVVTTDHGRSPIGGYSHGGDSESEKTIFIGMNKEGNQEFKTKATNIPNTNYNGLYGYPAQTSIVPTVLRHLGIEIRNEWQLSSPPLIGEDGPRKVMVTNSVGNEISWVSSSTGNAEIYRDNLLIATVPANQERYTDTNAPNGRINYTIRINNSIGSVNVQNCLAINAVLDWYDAANNRTYFFRGDNKYVRYSKVENTSDPGYPVAITNNNWPGLGNYKDKISAAFKTNYDKGYFFLSDGRYLRYNMVDDKVDAGYPKPVNFVTWPGLGLYGKKIIGAVNWHTNKAMFFLSDGRYIRYDLVKDKADAGYPVEINNSTWPGMEHYKTKITAVADWDTRYMFFFLNDNTFIKYDKSLDRAVQGYPEPINNTTWPGLLDR